MRNRNLITGRRRAPINVLVTALLAAASSLVLAPSADATTLIRKSKNHCAEASIEYEYFDDGEGTVNAGESRNCPRRVRVLACLL